MTKLLIKNINILTMKIEKILSKQDILIENGKIKDIQPTDRIKVGKIDQVIDGTGKYILPGLADMHVHLWNEDDMILFLSNGVTTVRNLWGSPAHLAWRDIYNENPKFLCPKIITTSPIVDGEPPLWPQSPIVSTSEEGRKFVKKSFHAGYDQIKIYNNLNREAYEGILEEAKELNIKVTGHIPTKIGIEDAIVLGQYCNEHLSGFITGWSKHYEDIPKWDYNNPNQYYEAILQKYNEPMTNELINKLIDKIVQHGMWNCVTTVVNAKVGRKDLYGKLMSQPGMKYMKPSRIASWQPNSDIDESDIYMGKLRTEMIGHLIKIIGKLHKQGGKILLGTDTPNPFVVPGFSVHEEIAFLRNAGLNPFEVLQTATSNVGEFMEDPTIGTIAIENDADLIIVDQNPLENLEVLKDPDFVIIRGEPLTREFLGMQLDRIEKKLNNPIYFGDMKDEIKEFDYFIQRYNGENNAQHRIRVGNDELIIETIDKYGDSLTSFYKSRNKIEMRQTSQSLSNRYEAIRENGRWKITVIAEDGNKNIQYAETDELYDDGLSFYLLNYISYKEINTQKEIEFQTISVYPEFKIIKKQTKIRRKQNKISFETKSEKTTEMVELLLESDTIVEISSQNNFGKYVSKLIRD